MCVLGGKEECPAGLPPMVDWVYCQKNRVSRKEVVKIIVVV
jgi:hypothetical protein